jgi:hypothetical protein
MSTAAPMPVARYLVSATSPQPTADFTRISQPLANGLPYAIRLDAQLRLVVALPTGLAMAWLDADPAAIVSRSSDQTVPPAAGATQPVGAIAYPPVRLYLLRDGTPLASVPLVAGLRRSVPDAGSDGVLVELLVLAWDLRAGTMRGPGDVGSWVDLAWRRADRVRVTGGAG